MKRQIHMMRQINITYYGTVLQNLAAEQNEAGLQDESKYEVRLP